MPKQIALTQSKFAIVDDGDYEYLLQWKWHFQPSITHPEAGYAIRAVSPGEMLFMHQAVIGRIHGKEIDHRDGNGLNNQRSNLRHATHRQNCFNVGPQRGRKFKGAYLELGTRHRNKWRCRIKVNGRLLSVGRFPTEIEAAKAFDRSAIVFHGEFARLNFPSESNVA